MYFISRKVSLTSNINLVGDMSYKSHTQNPQIFTIRPFYFCCGVGLSAYLDKQIRSLCILYCNKELRHVSHVEAVRVRDAVYRCQHYRNIPLLSLIQMLKFGVHILNLK